MNEYHTYTPPFKRRNELEQQLIQWATKIFEGKQSFGIKEARDRFIAKRDQLAKSGVRGSVTIGDVRPSGTWVGGDLESQEFEMHAPGRKLRSLVVSEHYPPTAVRACRVCGCTDDDCSGCIERTGHPCHWVAEDLCSACVTKPTQQ